MSRVSNKCSVIATDVMVPPLFDAKTGCPGDRHMRGQSTHALGVTVTSMVPHVIERWSKSVPSRGLSGSVVGVFLGLLVPFPLALAVGGLAYRLLVLEARADCAGQ